jgi:hypothetical protein
VSNVENGRANEWATALALSEVFDLPIEESTRSRAARSSFNNSTSVFQEHLSSAANELAKHIYTKETRNIVANLGEMVRFNSDSAGKTGDVRDVIVGFDHFSIGISCKNNHSAYKHSRLSSNIDWVRKWGLDPQGCSATYWAKVKPIFGELSRIRNSSNKTALFRDIPEFHENFTIPILDSFEAELRRVLVSRSDSSRPPASELISYVIGRKDFYKSIVRSNELEILGFNFNGSLSIPKSKLPTQIIAIDALEGSDLSRTVRFDRGYVLNFRLHNASSRVEPSLKFDVQAIGLPSSEIYSHHISLTA